LPGTLNGTGLEVFCDVERKHADFSPGTFWGDWPVHLCGVCMFWGSHLH
jgi:hypothetical protein